MRARYIVASAAVFFLSTVSTKANPRTIEFFCEAPHFLGDLKLRGSLAVEKSATPEDGGYWREINGEIEAKTPNKPLKFKVSGVSPIEDEEPLVSFPFQDQVEGRRNRQNTYIRSFRFSLGKKKEKAFSTIEIIYRGFLSIQKLRCWTK